MRSREQFEAGRIAGRNFTKTASATEIQSFLGGRKDGRPAEAADEDWWSGYMQALFEHDNVDRLEPRG